MPPVVSHLVMGFGSMLILIGIFLLLMALTMSPRATPTLIVFGRHCGLRAAAISMVLSGGLFMVIPYLYVPGVPARDRQVSPDHAGQVSHDPDSGSIATGGSVATEPPELRAPAEPQLSPPDEPFNITGEWTVTNTVLETSYQPYRHLRLGFRLVLHQEGHEFSGEGEKYLENGHTIRGAARSPLRIQGTVAEGAVIDAAFQEEGLSRRIHGRFRLNIQDRHQLTGTFISTAANAKGASQWMRASSRQMASADVREPYSRGRLGGPDPAPPAPVLADRLVALVTSPSAASRPGEPHAPALAGPRTVQQGRPKLQPGLSQAEVRDLLGEPSSVDDAPDFVYWQYGTAKYTAYVYFDKATGQVRGWLGIDP